MQEVSRSQRIIDGFSRYGFSLDAEGKKEFTKPDTDLKFAFSGAEGGIILVWTKTPASIADMLKESPLELGHRILCGGPDEFWGVVEDVIAGREPTGGTTFKRKNE